MSYSSDFRHCVLSNIKSGMSWDDSVKIFNISRSTISRWMSKLDRYGDLKDHYLPIRKIKIDRDQLIDYISKNQDDSLREIANIFKTHPSVIYYHFKKSGITRKKNHALRRARREKA